MRGKWWVYFLTSFVIGVLGTYLVAGGGSASPPKTAGLSPSGGTASTVIPKDGTVGGGSVTAETIASEANIFQDKGCVKCHSIAAYRVDAGKVGPDLSKAYQEVPDKYGLPLDEFLKKPTTTVMSGVIGGSPLTDDELSAIVAALKKAAEK